MFTGLTKDVETPKYQGSLGLNFFSNEEVKVYEGETVVIRLGIKIDTKRLKEATIFKKLSNPVCKNMFTDIERSFSEDLYQEFISTHFIEVQLTNEELIKVGAFLNTTAISLSRVNELTITITKPVGVFATVNGVFETTEIKRWESLGYFRIMEHKNKDVGLIL